MAEKRPVNAENVFRKILLVSKFYQDALEQLTQEMASGQYRPNDFTIKWLFTSPAYYRHYIEISRREGVDFSAFGTSLERIEQRWRELDFDARRDALLARLGPQETQQRLLEELTILVEAYCSKVSVLHSMWQEMAPEEFEELQQDDELYDLETLTLRSSIAVLLPLLAASEAKSALERELAQADATLRRHGRQMFGPLLRMGSIQQLRAARFEPQEHWWWYLDEIDTE
ncbi:MAG: hypothetical protein N2508_13765 [Anaerolineae bacterium]|nr:hypothetical protein [Anaerolineae bacterium]